MKCIARPTAIRDEANLVRSLVVAAATLITLIKFVTTINGTKNIAMLRFDRNKHILSFSATVNEITEQYFTG
jgi:hypothetical protein